MKKFQISCLGMALSGLIMESVGASTAYTLYGVQDQGLNNSQFFTINPNTLKVTSLPKGSYPEHDIEANSEWK